MPGFPLTVGTGLSCFHQAPAKIPVTQTSVSVLGQPVVTAPVTIPVIGCPFAPVVPQPCSEIRWLMVSTKVLVQGKPVLLMPPPDAGPGPGLCLLGPRPQGIPVVTANQAKVVAT